jgi:hypothetical protein
MQRKIGRGNFLVGNGLLNVSTLNLETYEPPLHVGPEVRNCMNHGNPDNRLKHSGLTAAVFGYFLAGENCE